MSAEYEVPNQNESIIDGIAINPAGALSGQALIFDNINNQFVPGSAAGNVNGFFVAGQIAYATGTQDLTTSSGSGISNFVWDDADGYLGIGTAIPAYQLDVRGDGYFTKRTIINGSTAAVSPSGTGAFRFNSGTNHLEFSENGGAWSQIGVGSVTSVSNSDSTLTISPTTGAVVASLNLGHANTWSAKQTFTSHIAVDGYTIDLSGGAVTNQVLTYNGTNFVAQNATGGISGTLTSPKVPYATGASTLADSAMSWDDSNKLLTVTTITGNNGLTITDSTRNLSLGVTSTVGQIGTTSNHSLAFYTNSASAQVTLNTSGFLGIGAAPSYMLHVAGDAYSSARLVVGPSSAAVSPSGNGAIRYNTSTDHLEFSENAGAWTAFGTGGGGMTIGGAISGATSNRILYSDGSSNLGDTILSLTSSELGPVSDNAVSLGDNTHRFVDGYFAGKIKLDGYTIDLTAGGTNGQALVYDTGTSTVHFSTVSGGGGSIGTTGQKFYSVFPAAFNSNNGTTTAMTVGAVRFDPTNHVLSGTTQSVVFRAIVANGSATVVGHVKLRDVTNSVDITTFNITAGTTSDTLFEQTLTVSTAGTNSIANSAAIYEVRIYVDSPVNVNDFIQLYSSELRNIQTIN